MRRSVKACVTGSTSNAYLMNEGGKSEGISISVKSTYIVEGRVEPPVEPVSDLNSKEDMFGSFCHLGRDEATYTYAVVPS